MKLRVMPKSEWLRNIKKRMWLRGSVLSLIISVWLLIDEYIKEGYWFNPADLTKIGTHESLMIVLLTLSGVFAIIHKKKEGGGGELVK